MSCDTALLSLENGCAEIPFHNSPPDLTHVFDITQKQGSYVSFDHKGSYDARICSVVCAFAVLLYFLLLAQ